MDVLVVFHTLSKDLKNPRYTTSIAYIFLESAQTSQTYLVMERTNVLKRSQRSLTSIIRSFAQQRFSANNKHLLVTTKCCTTLSKFGVVSNKIPRYLKVYTCSITSPLNINSLHESAKLNTMTFVFFTFTVSPHSAQNCWSTSNCCWNPTSDSNVRARSFSKSNNHTCTFAKAGASHSLLSKHPSRASKYSPNSRGLKRQPYFTPC